MILHEVIIIQPDLSLEYAKSPKYANPHLVCTLSVHFLIVNAIYRKEGTSRAIS